MPITKASGQAVAPAAKGDLVVGSATNDASVLAVGSNGQYLQADSSTTTGLKWATLSVGPTLLSTTNLSTSSTTVSSISQSYTDLIILVENPRVSSLGGGELSYRLNNDSGSFVYQRSLLISQTSSISNVTNANRIATNLTAKTTTNTDFSTLIIYNYANSTARKFIEMRETDSDSGRLGVAWYNSTSAITSVTFRANDGGSFDAGTIKIYGV